MEGKVQKVKDSGRWGEREQEQEGGKKDKTQVRVR